MRFYRTISVLGLLLACAMGCASSGNTSSAATRGPCEQCMVCKYNADLACVNVVVDSTTPEYLYQGQTYYFCSDECRAAFIKNPAKYLR